MAAGIWCSVADQGQPIGPEAVTSRSWLVETTNRDRGDAADRR